MCGVESLSEVNAFTLTRLRGAVGDGSGGCGGSGNAGGAMVIVPVGTAAVMQSVGFMKGRRVSTGTRDERGENSNIPMFA